LWENCNMKKILKFIIIIIISAGLGIAIFSFVVAERLYFPDIKQVANDGGAGLNIIAYQHDPWLWNKEKITIINIQDRKNDAPYVQYKLKGEVHNIRLVHSGEDFALIAYSDPDFSSMESGYVVHRSPKSESENTIEQIHIGGNIIAVAPDESGYFYISQDKIFKRSWQGKILLQADLGSELEPILSVQQIGMGSRQGYQPILFFHNNNKMAFYGTPLRERDGFLFIWDLEKNEIEKISPIESFPQYNRPITVENDKLYVEKAENIKITKKLIAE